MERITEYVGRLAIIKGENCTADAVKKLALYENAEADGRLAVLPAKSGDTIYIVCINGQIKKEKVRMISTFGRELFFHYEDKTCKGCVADSDFGKWVFLSREEAENALDGKADCI